MNTITVSLTYQADGDVEKAKAALEQAFGYYAGRPERISGPDYQVRCQSAKIAIPEPRMKATLYVLYNRNAVVGVHTFPELAETYLRDCAGYWPPELRPVRIDIDVELPLLEDPCPSLSSV